MSATGYAKAVDIVWDAMFNELSDIDNTVAAYLLLRAAALSVQALRGSEKAAELAYKIADELATQGVR